MTMDNLAAPLQRLPLFAGLKPLQLSEIVHRAERTSYWPGDVITKAGQPGDGAYLIVTGLARRVEDADHAVMLEVVETGSLIGELAMLVDYDYTSTVVARDRVLCLKLLRMEMHAHIQEDSMLAEHFRDRLTERLKRTAEDLRQIEDAIAARTPAPPQPPAERFLAAGPWYR